MPASICDPVSSALRLSLTADDSTNSALLDNRLISSAKSVLLTKIDFEESGDYQSNILDGLKSKYVVIRPKKPMQDNKQLKKDAINNSAPKDQQQQSQEYSLPVPKKILFPVESVRLGWSGKEWQVGTGMQNIGNTCYLNSTLQALFHVPALANWLMSEAQHSDKCRQSEGCVICGMRSTFLAAQRSSGPIKPWQVYSKLRLICRHLMPGRQEDAHEFLRYLVEAMEKSYLSRCGNMEKHLDQYSKETTPLNQILGGYLRSAVRCLSCGHVSTTFQHFQDLLLDIRKATTLEEALDLFFSRERLEDLGYKCEACNKKVSATKQFYIERAPMVLCIALKRFSLAGGKLSKHIQFRKKITLNKYIFHKNKQSLLSYRLVGMVTHLGPSQNCGHYTAIGQAPGGGYYQFDDSCVRSIPLSTVLGTNAYIIFFEKESCTPEETVVSSESPFKISKEIQKSTESTSSNTVYGPVLPDNVTMNREKGPMKLNFYKNDEQRQSISFTVANNQNANLKFSLKEMNGTSLSNGNGINMAQSTENEMPKSTAPLAIKQNGEIVPFRPTTLNVTPIDQSNGRTLDEGQSNKTANFITKGSKLVNYAHSNYTQSKSLSKLETKFDNSESNGHMNGVNHKNGDIGKNDLIQTKVLPVKSKTQLKTEKSEAELRTRIENHRLSETNSSGASAYGHGASTSSSVNGNGNRSSCVSNGARLVPYDSESSGDEKSRDDESLRPMRKSPLSCTGKPEVFITTKATQHCWKVSTEQNRPLLSPSLNGVVNNKVKENDLSTNGGKEVNGNHRSSPEDASSRVQVNGHSKTNGAKTGLINGHETVSKLQMMSHRGYGQPVQSWVGTHSSMGRQVFEEHRNERKRALEGVDEMDQGRVKKPRKFGKFNNTNESNNNPNPFQAKQNRQRDTHGGWRGSHARSSHPMHDRRSFHQNFYRNGNGNGPYKNYKRFDWHGRGHRYYRQH